MAKPNVAIGLDVGTTKVALAVGQIQEGMTKIVALAKSPNNGMRKGMIVDIEEAVSSLSACLEEGERKAGMPITSVFLGINGPHITSVDSKGVVAVSRADGEITSQDVDRAIEAARAIALPANYEILHVIPKYFIVDGQPDIKDPVGMSAIRLEVEAHVVGGSAPAIKNLIKVVSQSGLEIDDLIFSPLALAKAFLTKKQKEMGSALIDLGAASTSLAVFEEGDLIHTKVLPVGSLHITNDIAIGLRTSLEVAEQVKINFAETDLKKAKEGEKIDLSKISPEEREYVSKKYVAEIIEARLKEIFSMVKQELKKIGRDGMLPAGVVFTGGGSKLKGLIDFSKNFLKLPSSVGIPTLEISGMVDKLDDPIYATSVGLMLTGVEKSSAQGGSKLLILDKNVIGGMVEKAKKIFKQFLP